MCSVQPSHTPWGICTVSTPTCCCGMGGVRGFPCPHPPSHATNPPHIHNPQHTLSSPTHSVGKKMQFTDQRKFLPILAWTIEFSSLHSHWNHLEMMQLINRVISYFLVSSGINSLFLLEIFELCSIPFKCYWISCQEKHLYLVDTEADLANYRRKKLYIPI